MNEKKLSKQLFTVEAVIGITSTIMLLIIAGISPIIINFQPAIAIIVLVATTITFIIICLALTKMEQIVGYYKCSKCHHKYVPTYSSVLWSMHMGRTRYMTCPKCHKKSWQRKTL